MFFQQRLSFCSFNNNTPQKWTNGKAFNIMASAQFFATKSTPGSFGMLFAHFSPNSWNKFQICCTDMYLIRFQPNLAVFFVFLWISWDLADLPEFCGSATGWNIRSPVYTRTFLFTCNSAQFFSKIFSLPNRCPWSTRKCKRVLHADWNPRALNSIFLLGVFYI